MIGVGEKANEGFLCLKNGMRNKKKKKILTVTFRRINITTSYNYDVLMTKISNKMYFQPLNKKI